MRVEFCTSFARNSPLAEKFIDSWIDNNAVARLHVYFEGELDGVVARSDGNIIFHSLDSDPDRAAFLLRYSHMPTARGIVGENVMFQYQATKFCHKVFAQSFEVPKSDWWVWLDSDVEFTKPFDEEFYTKVFPKDALWVTLDREHLPETGFVGWKVGHPVARAALEAYRQLYATGEVFKLRQWDDCWAFRHIIRNVYSVWSDGLFDLCEGLDEQQVGDHPWPNTVLGEYMVHHKGPVRKGKAA